MGVLTAKIAVSAATYQIDRPYDYCVPEPLSGAAAIGKRVLVPFSRSNKKSEGIILDLFESADGAGLKCVSAVLDEEPVLTEELIRLALWMRERCFCTVYDSVQAMLPSGLRYQLSFVCRIAEGVDKQAAYSAAGSSEKLCRVLDAIYARGGVCDTKEIALALGGEDPVSVIKSLSNKGVVVTDSLENRRIKDKTVSFAALCVSQEDALALAEARKRAAPSQAAVLRLLSEYGGATIGDIRYLTAAGSQTIKKLQQDGLIVIDQLETFRRPDFSRGVQQPLPELSLQQKAAFDGLSALASGGKPSAALLYGVTGSGKTAVYVHLIDKLLGQDKASLLLVPEIALTPQMLETFSAYFGEEIAVLHSSLSTGERYDEYKRIKKGAARVVIGTRSAVFAPVSNLGAIIIDEEQEDSYKSESTPRYHARDVAKFRCARNNALLLLGSATPNVVTMYHAKTGRYSFFSLSERFNRLALPEVKIVDMKKELRSGNGGEISSVLMRELRENLDRGEQSILFLNRRGMSKLISCCECGYTYKCPRCSVNLTYHSANSRLMCHYCGHSQPVSDACPDCGGKLSFLGAGTQKIEEELHQAFPDTEILRLDADAVVCAGSHEVLLKKFREEKIPILVGTQMVTKGLDFPNVTLVGVLSADQSLYSGDYRASERTFSLITQVIGRSGRGDTAGRAVIQTFTPLNEVILQASRQDYDGFYASELELRALQWCPPFSELFSVTAVGQSEGAVLRCIGEAKSILAEQLRGRADVRLLGPAPLNVMRVNDRFRYRLTLACKDEKFIRELVSNVIIYSNSKKENKGVTVYGDINANQ